MRIVYKKIIKPNHLDYIVEPRVVYVPGSPVCIHATGLCYDNDIKKNTPSSKNKYIGVGTALGVSIGSAMGIRVFDNVGLGMGGA